MFCVFFFNKKKTREQAVTSQFVTIDCAPLHKHARWDIHEKKNVLGIGCLYQERLFLSCATKQKPTQTGEKPPSQATVACRNQIWSTAHAVASFMPKSAGQAYVKPGHHAGHRGMASAKEYLLITYRLPEKLGLGFFCVCASPHPLCVRASWSFMMRFKL